MNPLAYDEQENMQILHYADKTQQFTEHRDYSDIEDGDPPENIEQGGNRMITVVRKTPKTAFSQFRPRPRPFCARRQASL
jgi:hypothetical protein